MKGAPRKRLRVLHVVDSLAAGGMENGIVNVARYLPSEEFEVHVACLSRRGQFAERMPQPELVRCLGKTSGFSVAAACRLALLLRKVRPDVVHSHNLGPLIYTGLATLRGKTHSIVHGEHSMMTRAEMTPRRLQQRRAFYRGCRLVHTVGAGMLSELEQLGAPRLRPVPNGVDVTRFAPGCKDAARRQFGIPAGAQVIGIVARFGEHKGHRRLLEAFERLARERSNLHLLVAGCGGPEETPVRAIVAESPFESRIHLLGFRPNPEDCYRALDLLVIPSTNEGLSNAALEAMSCGVPVVGNPRCGHEELLDHGVSGWIADLSSACSIETSIRDRLAQPEGMMECGRRARLKVEAAFSLPRMAEAYATLYREAAPITPA